MLIYLSIIAGTISAIISLLTLLIQRPNFNTFYIEIVYIIIELTRIGLYVTVFPIAKVSLRLQGVLINLLAFVLSFMITEAHIYTGKEEIILFRILSSTSIALMCSQYTLFNFWYAILPYIMGITYPFLRSPKVMYTCGLPFIMGSFLLGIACSYLARRSLVTDHCKLYMSLKMNEQWKEIIDMLEYSVMIMSNELPASLLYYNSRLRVLINRICDDDVQDNKMSSLINNLKIKIIRTNSSTQHNIKKNNLVKFIENFNEETDGGLNYFLDIPKLLIEVKISGMIFDGKEAKIISLIDCSSAQRLEKVKTECKYKTILISNISHELRTPVNSILGTLELVEHLLPKESIMMLNMAKECCSLITSHINDLTVKHDLKAHRIMEECMRQR